MNDVILQTLYFVASYIGIIFLFWFSINFLTKGWLSCYLKVKASRGKKIMIHVLTKTDTYYKAGHFYKSALNYKARGGEKKKLSEIKRGDFWYEGGVHNILVDEETGTIYPYASGKPVHAGITPGGADEMVHRAITAPTPEDLFRKVIFAFLIINGIALIILAYFVYDTRQAVMSLGQLSGVI